MLGEMLRDIVRRYVGFNVKWLNIFDNKIEPIEDEL